MIKFKGETPEKVSMELGPQDMLVMYDCLHAVRQNPKVGDLQHEAILRIRAEVTKVLTPYVEQEDDEKKE